MDDVLLDNVETLDLEDSVVRLGRVIVSDRGLSTADGILVAREHVTSGSVIPATATAPARLRLRGLEREGVVADLRLRRTEHARAALRRLGFDSAQAVATFSASGRAVTWTARWNLAAALPLAALL